MSHVEVSAGGGGLSLQLFELPRTDREAIGTFLGLARAKRAARKRSRARERGETTHCGGLFFCFSRILKECNVTQKLERASPQKLAQSNLHRKAVPKRFSKVQKF